MATAEKGSLLKNVKIKIKDDKEEEKKTPSKEEIKFNVSGEVEKEKDSSKVSQDNNKEILNEKLELSEQQENLNSKVIKENSEEINNVQNSSKELENSENKSGSGSKNSSEKEEEKNQNGSGEVGRSNNNNNNSSFLNSNHYNNLQNMNENEDLNETNGENNSCFLDRTKPFLTTGKFMQIQPHFNIFSNQIEDLHNGIYENTKKCLIYKSSLQQSENLIREKADSVVKDLVDKIFNLRQLFNNANKSISMTINEVNQSVNKVKQIQAKTRKEINECDRRANDCEGQIGYKLLGKPNYSFMKRLYSTTAK